MGTVARMAFMWMLMTWFKSGKQPVGKVGDAAATLTHTAPKFAKGGLVDMYAFISERPHIRTYDVADLVWSETGIAIAESETRKYSVYYEPSQVGSNQIRRQLMSTWPPHVAPSLIFSAAWRPPNPPASSPGHASPCRPEQRLRLPAHPVCQSGLPHQPH